MKSLFSLVNCSLLYLASAHVFVGNPFPFHGSDVIDKLIMPMNGDSTHHPGPDWKQQPFPCKGFHKNASQIIPDTTWRTGTNVTFQ